MNALALDEPTLLWLHDQGRVRHPLDRALLILDACHAPGPSEPFELWPLGRRNRALLGLIAARRGGAVSGEVACPHCEQRLELPIDVAGMLELESPWECAAQREGRLECEGWSLRFRLPTSLDLGRVAGVAGPAAATSLLEACVLEAQLGGALESAASLPPSVRSRLGEQIEAADPLLELSFACRCPDCASQWSAPLDPGAFLWDEVEHAAWSVLEEVAQLGRAFGWGEEEALRLGPQRRRDYLSLCG